MSKVETNFDAPSVIAAFDCDYVLTAIYRSVSDAARITGALRQSLVKAAYGSIVSVKGMYWRTVPPDIQIEPDDLGVLTVFDFDAETGQDRKIYPTRHMFKRTAIYESEYMMLKKGVDKLHHTKIK